MRETGGGRARGYKERFGRRETVDRALPKFPPDERIKDTTPLFTEPFVDLGNDITTITPEEALRDHASSPEGLRAQGRIVESIFTGKGFVEPAEGPVEDAMRGIFEARSKQARAEIEAVIGVPAEEIAPEVPGILVTANEKHKNQILDYLIDAYGITEDPEKLKEENGLPIEVNQSALDVNRKNTSIHVLGPVVQLRFKTNAAYAGFNSVLAQGQSEGVFVKMPVNQTNTDNSVGFSDNVYLNFVQEEQGRGNGHRVDQHELWHAADVLRNTLFDNSQGRTVEERNQLLQKHLGHYFFDPGLYADAVLDCRQQAPEIFDLYARMYIGTEDEPDIVKKEHLAGAFRRDFIKLQYELPGHLAGYIDDGNHNLTDDHERNISNGLINDYTTFGMFDINVLTTSAEKDSRSGNWSVYRKAIKSALNHLASGKDNPDSVLAEKRDKVLDKYSEKGWRNKRANIDEEAYTRDMQAMLDFFLNGGGKSTKDVVRQGLRRSMASYKDLVAHRGNAYQALTELSVLPISHWETYTRRVTSEE